MSEPRCRIIYGAMFSNFRGLAGRSIAYVRLHLRTPFNIPDEAQVVVDGVPVYCEEEEFVPHRDCEIEFVRQSGTKGLGDLLSPADLRRRWQLTDEQYEELLRDGLPSLRLADGSVRHPEVAVDEWFVRLYQPRDLLTEEEAISYLRLDTINITNPSATLRRYRDMGLLRATQVSKKVFYRRGELDQLLDRLTEKNPR